MIDQPDALLALIANNTAPDGLADTLLQLTHKALQRAGVRILPTPIASYNPDVHGLVLCFPYIMVNEEHTGLQAIQAAISRRWTLNHALVNGINRLLVGLQQVIVVMLTPPNLPALAAPAVHPVHPMQVVWEAIQPFLRHVTEQFIYLDLKEQESRQRNVTQQALTYANTGSQVLTDAQRRVIAMGNTPPRTRGGGHHHRGGGGRGHGQDHYDAHQDDDYQPAPYQRGRGGRGGSGGRGGGGGRGGRRGY